LSSSQCTEDKSRQLKEKEIKRKEKRKKYQAVSEISRSLILLLLLLLLCHRSTFGRSDATFVASFNTLLGFTGLELLNFSSAGKSQKFHRKERRIWPSDHDDYRISISSRSFMREYLEHLLKR